MIDALSPETTKVWLEGDTEIVFSRSFDAPRSLVWKCWTDPEILPLWWGPNGFTNTVHGMDFRVGGTWRFTMHHVSGTDYPNKITYVEIEEPSRIVYDHGSDVDDIETGHAFRAIVLFEERGQTTTVTMRMICYSREDRDAKAKFGALEGAQQTMGRLARYIANSRVQL